jgi:hypothetical protein
MSKVPDWAFDGRYRLDFIGMRFRAGPSVLAVDNYREINGRISKTPQLTSDARPGRLSGLR